MQQISTPARRYAAALFAAAEEAKATSTLRPQVETLAACLEGPALETVTSPRLDRAARLAMAQKIIQVLKPHALLANTLHVLAENNRLSLLAEVLAAFTEQADAASGILPVLVESAAPLTEAQQQALKGEIKRHTKASGVNLANHVRPQLLGGFRAFYEGKVWDETVRGHLDTLKQTLRTKLSSHQKSLF